MRDSKRDTDVKNSLLDSVGKGVGGMIWKNSTETCILYVQLKIKQQIEKISVAEITESSVDITCTCLEMQFPPSCVILGKLQHPSLPVFPKCEKRKGLL